MAVETRAFDAARFITNREAEADFLRDALETGDPGHLTHVLGLIARARGVSSIADDLGISSDAVFDALDRGHASALRTLAEEVLSRTGSENAAAE